MADLIEKIEELTKAHRLLLNFDERKEKEADLRAEYARECIREHLKIARLKAEVRALKNETEALKTGDEEYVGRLLEEDRELQLAFKKLSPEEAKKKITDRLGLRRSQFDTQCFEVEKKEDQLFQLVTNQSLLDGYSAKINEMMLESKDFRNDFHSHMKEVETRANAAKNLEGILREIRNTLEEDICQHRVWLRASEKEMADQAKCKSAATGVFALVAADSSKLGAEYRHRERKLQANTKEHQASLEILQKHLKQLKEQSISLATNPQSLKVFSSEESISQQSNTDAQVKKLHHALKKMKQTLSVPQVSRVHARLLEMIAYREKLAMALEEKGSLHEKLAEEIERGRSALEKIQQEHENLEKTLEANKADIEKEIDRNEEKLKWLELEVNAASRFIIAVRHGLKGVWDGVASVCLPGQEEDFQPIEADIAPFEDCQQLAKAIEMKNKEFLSSLGEPESLNERERDEILIDHAVENSS